MPAEFPRRPDVIRKLLLVALMLPMFAAALVLPAGAAADTTYDSSSLTKLLITADDMKGLGYPLDETVNGKTSSNPINVGRYFTSKDNEVVNVNLLASEDGSVPPSDI